MPASTSYRAYAQAVSDTLGERIKSLRTRRGLTGAQLAARIGIGENAVFKLESGTSAEPKFFVGLKIARALGVTPDELAFGKAGPGEPNSPQSDTEREIQARLGRVEAYAQVVPNLALELKELNESVRDLVNARVSLEAEQRRIAALVARSSTGRKAK